jgi:hypothetical protein
MFISGVHFINTVLSLIKIVIFFFGEEILFLNSETRTRVARIIIYFLFLGVLPIN